MTRVNWCKLMVAATVFGCSSASADTATVPKVFVDDTPALADEVNQNFNALATVINANISAVTVISLDDLAPGGEVFDQTGDELGTLGFNKRSASSHILIFYEDTLRSLNQGSACAVGVFVDGLNSRGMPEPAFAPPLVQTDSRDFVSLSSIGVFTGLAAGTHEIKLIGGVANNDCMRGDMPFGLAGQITVVETPQLETP